MARVVMTFAVDDVPVWKARHAERAMRLPPFTSQVTDYLPLDGCNVVAVTANVNDMPRFTAAVLLPAIGDSDGAQEQSRPLTVWIEEDGAD